MATIIIKNSTGSGVIPSSLQQGELAINTKDGRLFYGSGSGNVVKEFISASYAQTASNILGGKATHIPFFITDTSLSTSSIYQSGSTTVIINQDNATTANPEALYVYQPSTTSFNVISGKGNLNNYLQLNIQNTNQGTTASSDVVATANNGNESSNYIDMGINSENYAQNFIGAANDAYLYSTGNDLHIGNVTSNKALQFFVGGSDVDIYNKLQLGPNNQHQMSGSLDVSGSIKAFSFTGSLQGNATSATTSQTSSYSTTLGASLSQPANNQVRLLNSAGGTLSTTTINNVTSASHADNASTANFATIAGNGGVTQLQAGSGVTLIPSTGLGNVTIAATGIGGVTIISGSNVTQSFSNSSTWTFTHNLQTRVPIISVFDTNYNQIIPENITLVDTASATITFPTAESGFAVASLGGATGYVLSSSYASLAEIARTASYYPESDPVYISQKPTLATTGSNIFKGNQIVTGSLFTTGSNTLIGTTTLTGSLNITGSTTQTGNNTLIGTTTLTGSILISGDVIPTASSSFDLGSVTNPWRSIYLQSGSISVQSDTPGGPDAIISNANGNISIAAAGFQLKSGSATPFTIDQSGNVIITGSLKVSGSLTEIGDTVLTGSLTLSSGSRLNLNNGFYVNGNLQYNYGQFSSTQTQSGSADTAYSMTFNTTDFSNGVTLVSGSRITIANTGIYNIQFSSQLHTTANNQQVDFSIWFAMTGSNIANSNTDFSIERTIGGGYAVAALNFLTQIASGSYIELKYSKTTLEGELQAKGTQATPTRPATPSAIVTVTQVA